MQRLFVIFMSLFMIGPLSALDGNEILKKLDRNLNPESFESYRKLINIEPNGRRKEFVLFTVKKGRIGSLPCFCSRPAKRAAAPFVWMKICGFTSLM